jgi:glycosyltransferase involved in cell wall biosynthesis
MKLIIQIPCYNEEKTLPLTLIDLPKAIEGIDEIETLVINDGSTDRTVEVAQQCGVNHILSFRRNKGLAKAFEVGLQKSLELGADIIVTTDGDNQYNGHYIENLVRPILSGEADVTIGDRQTNTIEHFSPIKKFLQRLGTLIIKNISHVEINDAVSGFRAFSRETALSINILTDFSYTIENLIQLGNKKTNVISVPIKTNNKLRESRLFKNTPDFILKQSLTIIRAYSTYKALKIFLISGILLILPGLYGFIRFIYFYLNNEGSGHIQSLVFSTTFIIIGFLLLMFGILADLISTNRKLLEKIIEMQRKELWKK